MHLVIRYSQFFKPRTFISREDGIGYMRNELKILYLILQFTGLTQARKFNEVYIDWLILVNVFMLLLLTRLITSWCHVYPERTSSLIFFIFRILFLRERVQTIA